MEREQRHWKFRMFVLTWIAALAFLMVRPFEPWKTVHLWYSFFVLLVLIGWALVFTSYQYRWLNNLDSLCEPKVERYALYQTVDFLRKHSTYDAISVIGVTQVLLRQLDMNLKQGSHSPISDFTQDVLICYRFYQKGEVGFPTIKNSKRFK